MKVVLVMALVALLGGPPAPVWPGSGAIVYEPLIRWAAVVDAVEYRLQVRQGEDVVYQVDTAGLEVMADLDSGGDYCYRVRASDGEEWGDYGAETCFTYYARDGGTVENLDWADFVSAIGAVLSHAGVTALVIAVFGAGFAAAVARAVKGSVR